MLLMICNEFDKKSYSMKPTNEKLKQAMWEMGKKAILKHHDFISDVSIIRHKWKNDKCVKCGCEREMMLGNYVYSRTGIIKSKAIDLECIDWDVENAKTID